MTTKSAVDCLHFETLVRRHVLTDDEVEFCLDHIDVCPLGIHNAATRNRTADAMLRLLQETEPTADVTARDIEDSTDDLDKEPWSSLCLGDALRVDVRQAVSIEPGEAPTVEARDVPVTDETLKRSLGWLGDYVRITRTFSEARRAYVYQARTTSRPEGADGFILKIVLVDQQDRESVAVLTQKMPRAVFVGLADDPEWNSLSILLVAAEND